MQKFELVKRLAEQDREYVEKLEEARQSADAKLAGAQEEARRILKEAEARIREMEETSRVQITDAEKKIIDEGRTRAEAEADRILRQSDTHIEDAVTYILQEVLP